MRPRDFRQDPHEQRRREAVCSVVGQADWQKAEHERARRRPEPEVLMEQVKNGNRDSDHERFGTHFSLHTPEGAKSFQPPASSFRLQTSQFSLPNSYFILTSALSIQHSEFLRRSLM